MYVFVSLDSVPLIGGILVRFYCLPAPLSPHVPIPTMRASLASSEGQDAFGCRMRPSGGYAH